MPCPYDRGIRFSRALVKGAMRTGGRKMLPLPIAALIADLRLRLGISEATAPPTSRATSRGQEIPCPTRLLGVVPNTLFL